MQGGRPVPSLGSFGAREEDPSLDELLAGAPVPKEFKTPSKKKK
jgi:hypothetical protein